MNKTINAWLTYYILYALQYPAGPLWQVPFAEIIKKEVGIATGAVGIITKGPEGESILQENKADFVCVAREFLRDGGFALTAARELGVPVKWTNQFERADRERSIPKSKFQIRYIIDLLAYFFIVATL